MRAFIALPHLLIAGWLTTSICTAANITWNTGNGQWQDNGSALNWSPADEPDADDVAIFNTAVTVAMTTANSIAGLTLNNSAILNSGGFNLTINGNVSLQNSARFEIPTGSAISAKRLSTASSGTVNLAGGNFILPADGSPVLSIAQTSSIRGFGGIGFSGNPSSPITLLDNNGTIVASRGTTLPGNSKPPAGMVQLITNSANSRFDLDGSGENGQVTIGDQQTLDINSTLSDAFGGTLTMGRDTVFDLATPWTFNGTLLANNAADSSFFISGGSATIRGGSLTQSGGTINIPQLAHLEIATPFTMNGGSLTLGGTFVLGADATITSGATINSTTSIGILAVKPGVTATIQTPISNPGILRADGGILDIQSSASDYDGASNSAHIIASDGGTLRLRQISASSFLFRGHATVSNGGTIVHTPGGAGEYTSSSFVTLNAGKIQSDSGIQFSGNVNIGPGISSIEGLAPFQTIFSGTSTVSVAGEFSSSGGIRIENGATVSGAGLLKVPETKPLTIQGSSLVNVHIHNDGILNSGGRVKSYEQSNTGSYNVTLGGLAPGQFSQLTVIGNATMNGKLRISLANGYTPAIGDSFDIVSAANLTGDIDLIQPDNQPNNRAFNLVKTSSLLRLVVTPPTPFQAWVRPFFLNLFGFDEARASAGGDPDGDGLDNFAEFALDGHPASAAVPMKIFGKPNVVGGSSVFTFTIPVRNGTIQDPADPPGGELILRNSADGITYRIQASANLVDFNLDVTEVTGAEATAIQSGLTPPSSGWAYRTFRSPGTINGASARFMRALATD